MRINSQEIARRLKQLLAYENDQTKKRWQSKPKPKPPEPPRRFKPLDMTHLRQRRAGWAARRLGIERRTLTDEDVRFLASPAVLRRVRAGYPVRLPSAEMHDHAHRSSRAVSRR